MVFTIVTGAVTVLTIVMADTDGVVMVLTTVTGSIFSEMTIVLTRVTGAIEAALSVKVVG